MSRITQQVGSKVKLYYRQIFFPVSDDHLVLIEMIPHPDALIKVIDIFSHIGTRALWNNHNYVY